MSLSVRAVATSAGSCAQKASTQPSGTDVLTFTKRSPKRCRVIGALADHHLLAPGRFHQSLGPDAGADGFQHEEIAVRGIDRQREAFDGGRSLLDFALLARSMRRTSAIHSGFTFSPASPPRWAMTLAPSTLVARSAQASSTAGAATSAPTRRPARPSHLEKESETMAPSGAASSAG